MQVFDNLMLISLHCRILWKNTWGSNILITICIFNNFHLFFLEIKCEPPWVPKNGQVRIRKGTYDLAIFECDEGYQLKPDIHVLVCTDEGKWNETEPSCIGEIKT